MVQYDCTYSDTNCQILKTIAWYISQKFGSWWTGRILRFTVERHLWAVSNDGHLYPATSLLCFNQPCNSLGCNHFCWQWYGAGNARSKCWARSPSTVGDRVTRKRMWHGFVVEERCQLAVLCTKHLYYLPVQLQLQPLTTVNAKTSILFSKNVRIFPIITIFINIFNLKHH